MLICVCLCVCGERADYNVCVRPPQRERSQVQSRSLSRPRCHRSNPQRISTSSLPPPPRIVPLEAECHFTFVGLRRRVNFSVFYERGSERIIVAVCLSSVRSSSCAPAIAFSTQSSPLVFCITYFFLKFSLSFLSLYFSGSWILIYKSLPGFLLFVYKIKRWIFEVISTKNQEKYSV